MADNNKQCAGNNSTQIQAATYIAYEGISEERVREIVNGYCNEAVVRCLSESRYIAERRISEFKTELFTQFASKPELIASLREPSCATTLQKAATSATESDDGDGNKILSRLLVERFERPEDKHVAVGVNRAIEVVGSLSQDELLGLILFYAIHYYTPNVGNVSEGLESLNELFAKLCLDDLPKGGLWIDDLEICDALRVNPLSSLKPLDEYYFEVLDGYPTRGIDLGSKDEEAAVELLKGSSLSSGLLVDHELNPGYKRLNVRSLDLSQDLQKFGKLSMQPFSDKQIEALFQVAELGKGDECNDSIKENLRLAIDSFSDISKAREWWKQIPCAVTITGVGCALANANARRIDPSLPAREW